MSDNATDTKPIEGLFYSKTDKKLFYIPNYYTHGTGMVKVLIENLKECEAVIRKFAPESVSGDVYCREITKSSRYKSMWCFSVDFETCPDEAFELGDDWTMTKWIEN